MIGPVPSLRPGEPGGDLVAAAGAANGPAQLGVVLVVLVAVPLAAIPLGHLDHPGRTSVDPEVEAHIVQVPLGDHRHRLRVAVRRGERVDHEVGCRPPDRRLRVVGVVRGPRHRKRERDVLLELRLDQVLAVGEVEAACAVLGQPLVVGDGVGGHLTRRHLRGEAEHAVQLRHVRVGVTVGGVQLRRDVGVVAGDRRVRVVTGERDADLVVRRRRRHLPAGAVEQELGRGVIVHEELEADPPDERVHRLRLRLGSRSRPAVGLAAGIGRGTLVVVAPLVGQVAVQVDAVTGRDHTVTIVVPQVLAPQPLVRLKGEVIPVGVRDRDEPQLVAVDQPGDLRVGAVVVDEVMQQAADHLGGDPLTGVLSTEVEHRGLLAVPGLRGVLRELDRGDVLAVDRMADAHDLGDARVVGGHLLELLLEPAGTGVLLVDLVTLRGRQRRTLGGGQPIHLLRAHRDALAAQPPGLRLAQNHLDPDLGLLPALAGNPAELEVMAVDAEGEDVLDLPRRHLPDIHVEMITIARSGTGPHRGQAESHQGKRGHGDQEKSTHDDTPADGTGWSTTAPTCPGRVSVSMGPKI